MFLELYPINKGWRFNSFLEKAIAAELTFDLTYVNLPIVLKYYLVSGLHIQLGPQFGVLIDESLSETLTNDYKEIVESQISGIIGVGYDLPCGLRIDGRYNFGLTDISKSVAENEGIKNSVFTLAVGFAFL